MSALSLDVSLANQDLILNTLALIWSEAGSKGAVDFKIHKNEGIHELILYWHPDKETTPLPFNHDLEASSNMANQWLKTAEYPKITNGGDGDYVKGFRVYNQVRFPTPYSHYEICRIQAVYIYYGK